MDSSKAGGTKRTLAGVYLALALILALFVGEQNLERVARALRVHPTAGTVGLEAATTAYRGRWAGRVAAIVPGGAAAKAGLRPGDLIVPDNAAQWGEAISTEVPIGLTVIRDGQGRHLAIAPDRLRGPVDWPKAAMNAALLVYLVFGALLVLLSRGRPAALLLGTALVAYAENTGLEPLLATSSLAFSLTLLTQAIYALMYLLFLAFAVHLHELARRRRSLAVRSVAIAAGAASTLGVAAYAWSQTGGPPPWSGLGDQLIFFITAAALVAALGILFDAWRRAYAETRERYLILLIAFGVIVAGQLITDAEAALSNSYQIAVWVAVVSAIVAPPLLAYAILGQRVIDVGFAVNRTLVYGVVSAILLVAFGLIEWGVGHLLPVEGREKNAFIDAALALGVFLTFHRVRDGVEHVVERVFFRTWQQREAALKRFLRTAPFITRTEALAAAAMHEISAYGDAPAAIYLAEADGGLRRIAGELEQVPERLDANLAPLVTLRADPGPLELGASDPFGASLLLPMPNRNLIGGAILLGPRSKAAAWRPDQVQLLNVAAREIGQNLQALELDEMQSAGAALTRENAQLAHENLVLRELRSVGG